MKLNKIDHDLNSRMGCLHPKEVMFRIFASFVPPYNKTYQKIYVDLLGPLLALVFLFMLLFYGNANKESKIFLTPIEAVMSYAVFMPTLCYLLAKLGHSDVTFCEALSLVGYATYGHLFTLVTSFLYYSDESDFVFFVALIIFSGLSTLRLALLFQNAISLAVVRLIVCSLISIMNILYILLFHFGFMHQTWSHRQTYNGDITDKEW